MTTLNEKIDHTLRALDEAKNPKFEFVKGTLLAARARITILENQLAATETLRGKMAMQVLPSRIARVDPDQLLEYCRTDIVAEAYVWADQVLAMKDKQPGEPEVSLSSYEQLEQRISRACEGPREYDLHDKFTVLGVTCYVFAIDQTAAGRLYHFSTSHGRYHATAEEIAELRTRYGSQSALPNRAQRGIGLARYRQDGQRPAGAHPAPVPYEHRPGCRDPPSPDTRADGRMGAVHPLQRPSTRVAAVDRHQPTSAQPRTHDFAGDRYMTTHHPLKNIAEWRKGCTCAPKDSPAECIDCTVGLITAVENWFNERVECAKDQNRVNSACHCTHPECGVIFGDLQVKCMFCDAPVATYVPLASQAGLKLADRLAVAICGDRQIDGFDVELLSQGTMGTRLSALIVEMAGYEAEAYALQDQVEEANSSVTALEQRVAEADKVLRALSEGLDHSGWSVGSDVWEAAEAWLHEE